MCDAANLIDLSLSFEEDISKQKLEGEYPLATTDIASTTATVSSSLLMPFNMSPPLQRRESLDNNPFDSVQKLAHRPNDPFEIVEKEACLKARLSIVPRAEVKLAKLLSLSDDNLIDDVEPSGVFYDISYQTETNAPNNNYSYNCATGCNKHNSAREHSLDSESPPISMSLKMTPESGELWAGVGTSASSTDGSGSMGSSAKTKKALEYRQHLLKLSISNSTFNSPVSRYMATALPQINDACFAESNCFSSMSAILSEAAQSSDNLLSAESPLKFVDDDLMSEEPPKNFLQSEKDYDADLEMLKIPILKQLPTSEVAKSHSFQNIKRNHCKLLVSGGVKSDSDLSDLTALRAKLKVKRETQHNNNSQNISELLFSLKNLICDIDAVDDLKKQKASSLLETLSSALEVSKKDESNSAQNKSCSMEPKPITRQGTFDLDLQEKKRSHEKEDHLPDTSAISEESSANAIPNVGSTEEMPDVMIRSSATYDGETHAEKSEFNLDLPEVETLPPVLKHDINDIVEQLSKLLEQHQLTQHALSDISGGAGPSAANSTTPAALNPTFIVVMNTSQYPAADAAALQEPSAKHRSSYMASDSENSFNNGSPDLPNSSAMMRRRSQSLSIHDKVKIVQLPLYPPAPVMSLPTDQTALSPSSTPPSDAVTASEFKTPMRTVLRRNSFSSGTPYTPRIATSSYTVKRSNIYSETSIKSSNYYRRSTALETHHERQQQHALVHPMPFKPDLKKKLKTSSSADSILKSACPLKATIPVKKVAPMLKGDYRLGDVASASTSFHKSNNNLNSSMHLLTRSGRLSYTSTPMPAPRTATGGAGAAGFPNACSTPTVHNLSIKRTGPRVNKPCYSHISVTPAAKALAANTGGTTAAATVLKRRTLSEFRAKSPLKPRVSSIGVPITDKAREMVVTTRTGTRLPPYIAKTPKKGAPVSSFATSTCLPSSSGRLSAKVSNATTTKNKENKQP